MGCTTCNTKGCRTESKDCFGIKELSLSFYSQEEINNMARSASALIDNGRAGTLNRLEEVMEYCLDREYSRVGVAYCFGLPDLASSIEKEIKSRGLTPVMVQCTAGGVLEREIDPGKTKDTVSCNPVGQALTLKKKNVDFVIEAGLCMGHDVIFHQTLDIPHTTLIVKDRIYQHNPALALDGYRDLNTRFLENLDDSMNRKQPHELHERMNENDAPVILDLRPVAKYDAGHIPGSHSAPLQNLPSRYLELLGKNVYRSVFLIGDDPAQSAFGQMFLFGRGYKNLQELDGGIQRWMEDGLPVVEKQIESVIR